MEKTQIKKRKFDDLIILGTRPEIIKFAPLIKQIDCYVVHTGQHKELADEAFGIFDIKPDVNLNLMKDNQTPSQFISSALEILTDIIQITEPYRVWVQGDTMTAYVGALAGFLAKKTVVHLEAGLRSGDKYQPYPEEIFRKFIDDVADIHLCPTLNSKNNLEKENIKNGFVCGNTIVDAINMIDLPDERPVKDDYVLFTMHRREAIGEPMEEVFSAIKELSKKIKVIYPTHPNPLVQSLAKKSGLELMPPLDYRNFLWYLKHCKFVITDSGGVQEEAPSFKKPIIVVRNKTERPEIISAGMGVLAGWDKNTILAFANELLESKDFYNYMSKKVNPFGDGKAVKKIKKYIGL